MKRHRKISKSEMIGFIVLMIIIITISMVYSFRDVIFREPAKLTLLSVQEKQELEDFVQQIKTDSVARQKRLRKFERQPDTLNPFVFNPNTADSATLSKLGLKHWQISNLLKYRKKGGKWKNAHEFSKLYGLRHEDFEQLRPFIQIPRTTKDSLQEREQIRKDSLYNTFPKKFKTDTILQLNDIDTTLLKRIPGIGSYYAQKICRYRERLGGFVSIEQLKDIDGLPQNIEKWFSISPTSKIKQTEINKSDFKGLIKHPYLNYEQVKYICNYIRKYGKIKSWEDLSNSPNFTDSAINRLRPYISFE